MTRSKRAGRAGVRGFFGRTWSGLASGLALVGVLGLGVALTPGCKTTPRQDAPLREGVELPELSDKQADELGAWVASLYSGGGGEAPAILREGQGSAYVALRGQGKLLGEAWGSDGNVGKSLEDALAKAKAKLPAGASPAMAEIDLAHSFESVDKPINKKIYNFASNKRVGLRGLELSYGDHELRVAPTEMVADGQRRFSEVVDPFLKEAGAGNLQKFAEGGGKARVFEAQQFIVRLPSGDGVKLLRGNVYVEPREVTRANTQTTVDLLIEWMLTHLHDDGRMTYMWYPTESREKPNDNNMIRQWMATNALIKVAEKRDDQQLWDRIEKNIDYNLEHFYEQDGDNGLIKYRGKVKLGALSLAAMAIVNHPKRAKWREQEHGLRRSIASLWQDDGAFECFFGITGRGDRNANVQNFYPGETLLLWAQLYRESRDPELLRRFIASFEYYKTWHLDPTDPKRRRPSFTPWHTQADFIVWETLRAGAPAETGEGESESEGEGEGEGEGQGDGDGEGDQPALTPEGWPVGTTPEPPTQIDPQTLAEFVFEMNDWLVDKMAVWEESHFDDEKGRFFSRKHDYGGAHASATGVYIEGLIDAYEMAKILGDDKREELYRESLARAIRSIMQLQYVDDIDMYYVTDRAQTKGGLRTTITRNEVRVDNVQHVLMGMIKLLDRFGPDDYATD